MRAFSQALSIILPAIYLLIVFLYGYIFFKRNKILETKTIFVLIVLFVIHATHIVLRGTAIGTFPLSTKLDALSFLAFTIVFVNLIIELSVKTKATVFFALVLSFIIQAVSSIFYNWDLIHNPLLSNPIFLVHVIMAVAGYAAICISALYALLYILLNHNIKYHRMGLIYERLPSLSLLERMSIRSVQIGIISLGLGIILGHLHAGDALDTYWPNDAKVIFSNIIWFGYFIGYIVAQLKNWRGRWMAYLSMVGFGIFIIANITIIFIENTFHQFQ
jgi:ABC-type uncharacterized transport system permease subunit